MTDQGQGDRHRSAGSSGPGDEDARYDFPPGAAPSQFYMVASTPRSGSHLVAHHLWRSGVMGAPLEYFNFYNFMFAMARRLRAGRFSEYLDALMHVRTAPNGAFSFKAHYDQFVFLNMTGGLRRLRPLKILSIERRDEVAQAVSFAKALQTESWNARDAPVAAPAYRFDQIAQCLRTVRRQKTHWEETFRRLRVEPVRVVYEDFLLASEPTTDRVLAAFGLERDSAFKIDLPLIERQFDAVNAEWIARFRREAAERRSGAATTGQPQA